MGNLVKPEDLHQLRYFGAMRVSTTALSHVLFMLLPNDGKTIKERLFTGKYSETEYKKDFTPEERQWIDSHFRERTNTVGPGCDVILFYKLLQKICNLAPIDDDKWNSPGTLENSIKHILEHRNVLAYRKPPFTSFEILCQVNKLKNWCRTSLESAGARCKKSVISYIDQMEKGMDEVLHGSIYLLEPYKEDLNLFLNKHSTVLIRKGRNDLRAYTKKNRFSSPFAWMLESEEFNLNVRSEVKHISNLKDVNCSTEFSIEKLLARNSLYSTKSPQRIIISGPPGIGKTSLVCFILNDWLSYCPKILGLENVDLVLPVDLYHNSCNNVKDLLNDLLPSAALHLQSDMLSVLKSVSILWLLDGFDGASMETKGLVGDIFTDFPGSRFIITTRPLLRNGLVIKTEDISLELLVFSEDKVKLHAKELIESCLHGEENRHSLFNSFTDFIQEWYKWNGEFLGRPLLLSIVILLWLENRHISIHKTMSTVCIQFFRHIVNRLTLRESYKSLQVTRPLLIQNIHEFLNEVGKILWYKVYDGLSEQQVRTLEIKSTKLGLPFEETMSAFFYSSKVTKEYTIMPRTLRTFLNARAFCNEMIAKIWDVETTILHWNILKETKSMESVFKKEKDSHINSAKERTSFTCKKYMYFRENRNCKACKPPSLQWVTISLLGPFENWSEFRTFLDSMVIAFIVGYLNIKEELNDSRVEQLLFLCMEQVPFMKYSAFYHKFFIEGDGSLFNQRLAEYLQNITWIMNRDTDFALAKKMFQYFIPKNIYLHYCSKLTLWDYYQSMEEVKARVLLDECIKTILVHPVGVHLDLSYFLGKSSVEETNYVDSCVEKFAGCDSKAHLLTLHCPVSPLSGLIYNLKSFTKLEELSIRVSILELKELFDVVQNIESLKTFRLALDRVCFHKFDIPSLYPLRNADEDTGLDISDIPSVQWKHSADFILVVPDFSQVKPETLGKALGMVFPKLSHIILLRGSAVPYSQVKWNDEEITSCIEIMHQHVLCIAQAVKQIDLIEVMMCELSEAVVADKMPANFYKKYSQKTEDILRDHSPNTRFKLTLLQSENFEINNFMYYSSLAETMITFPPNYF